MRNQTRQWRWLEDLVVGAVAGVVGTWSMERVTRRMPPLPGSSPRQVAPGAQEESSTRKLARKVSRRLGRQPSESALNRMALAVHYGYGTFLGAAYGLIRRRTAGKVVASGLLLGFLLWLVSDEVMVPALGLSKPPGEVDINAHAKGLGAHLAYGLTTDGALRTLHRLTRAWA